LILFFCIFAIYTKNTNCHSHLYEFRVSSIITYLYTAITSSKRDPRQHAYPNQWFGDNDEEADYGSIPNNAADLAELIMKKLDLAPAHLIGHSYGAFTALYLAYKHPELVRTLVLGEPPVIPLLDTREIDALRENAFKPTLEAIRLGQREKAVKIFLDGVMGKEGFFDQVPLHARALIMDNAKSLGAELGSSFPSFTCEAAQRITVPTLLVIGELSPKFLHHVIDILARCMPNTSQITIPEVSHDLGLVTRPEIFNTKVLEFLVKHS
jgi:pimeloyl-ACP methyl ester carboxylesterase